LNVSGNLVWVRSAGGTGHDHGNRIETDNSGNVLVIGSFQNTVDFNVNAGVDNLTSNGGDDIFILRLDLNGNYNWARKIGSIGDDSGKSIKIDVFGNIIATGYFNNTVDFDPNANVYNLSSNGSYDVFVL